MHTVAVLVMPDTIALDATMPIEAFGRVQLPTGAPGYDVLICGTEPVVTAGPMGIATDHGIDALARADTIVVAGRYDVTAPVPDGVLTALREAVAAGIRVASICAGAFTLAEAGILDGRRATTHWLGTELFRARFPAVDLDPDVLYVDERSGADVGGRLGRARSVLAHGPARLRIGGGRRCRAGLCGAVAPKRWAGSVHRAKSPGRHAHCRTHRTRRRAGLDRE